jgi:anti-sigma regulatory factor (Ser/Thr protein kinase)
MAPTSTFPTAARDAFRWTLQEDPALLSELRIRLRRYLAPPAVPVEVATDVILSLHEAAKNALRAGGRRPVEIVVWTEDELVWACVRDHGAAGFPATGSSRRPPAWQTHGRGLFLMHSLMDSVEIDSSDGVTVFMSKRRSPLL